MPKCRAAKAPIDMPQTCASCTFKVRKHVDALARCARSREPGNLVGLHLSRYASRSAESVPKRVPFAGGWTRCDGRFLRCHL